jgi:hypothetical protein
MKTYEPDVARLPPAMVTFLRGHSMARSAVYVMMMNAATTRDDAEMGAWYAPVEAAAPSGEKAVRDARCRLVETTETTGGTIMTAEEHVSAWLHAHWPPHQVWSGEVAASLTALLVAACVEPTR